MTLGRREFIQGSSLLATLAALSCSRSSGGGATLVDKSADPLVLRGLHRFGFGHRPGDVDRVSAQGILEHLEEQLHPEAIDDSRTEQLVAALSTYSLPLAELRKQPYTLVQYELGLATFLRAQLSSRQLHEAMVEFWSDHFYVTVTKNPFINYLKVVDDRDVIRPRALGRFKDLVKAVVKSTAMLSFLDNIQNEKGNPNENYARELMELHTLGVTAGYSQVDVEELARALTGWGMHLDGERIGEFRYDDSLHDYGEKRVFGLDLPGSDGEDEVSRLIDHLCEQPATAHFLATKLSRRFVADDPPAGLVAEVGRTYLATGGNVKSMLRAIFRSREFAAAPKKLKRPFKYAVSVLRALGCDEQVTEAALQALPGLGQPLYFWPMPNGYPDVAEAWLPGLLNRWNFCLELLDGGHERVNDAVRALLGGSRSRGAALDALSSGILGTSLERGVRNALFDHVGAGGFDDPLTEERWREVAALLLSHPDFQWS